MSGSRSEGEHLPIRMASLELLDEAREASGEPETGARRGLRKRTAPEPPAKRRVKLKPRRISPVLRSSPPTDAEIAGLYENQKVSPTTRTLETIFEEPKTVNDTVVLIGGKKIRRALKFREFPAAAKDKIKKRRSRIKRLLGNKNFTNRKKITMNAFRQTLQSLQEDEDEPSEK